MTTSAYPIDTLRAELPALDWITEPHRVENLSRDFAWYSPVLERTLAGKHGDIAVRPRTEDEIRAVVGACARLAIPITLRGTGTGNYGQCTPLHGGLILDMSAYNAFLWARPGVGRAGRHPPGGLRRRRAAAGLGAALAALHLPQRHAGRPVRRRLRRRGLAALRAAGCAGQHPGGARHDRGARAADHRTARARSAGDAPCVRHQRHRAGAGGGPGPAHDWLEGVATFDDFDAALRFGADLGRAPGLVTKEVSFMAAPITDYFTKLGLPQGRHAVVFLAAEFCEETIAQMLAERGGTLSYRATAAEVAASRRTLLEYVWNHTTLHAFKVEKNLTYIQSAYNPSCYLEQVRTLAQRFAGEVQMHVEFLRTKEGEYSCSGLEIICTRDETRLAEIMQAYRDSGVVINNPHTCYVEEGKQNLKLNPQVLAMKQRFDPQGLLNPGKLKSWAPAQPLAQEPAHA
jgi:hypothetical protein